MNKKTMVLLFFIVCLFHVSSVMAIDRGFRVVSHDGTNGEQYLYKGSYAFLLGIDRYTGGWEPLSNAVDDIHDVARALKRHGFEVSLNENLTKEEFDRAFTRFIVTNGQDPDNRLFFYFAGHGYTKTMATGEELGYLVMVDAPLPDIDQVNFIVKSVDMQSLITQARLIKSKHALFMFDSCFSGSILNTRALVRKPKAMSKYAAEPVRQFITAGRANEAVPDRSYFKEAFINILDGREKEPVEDGMLTGEELGWFLKSKVTMYNPSQHPQYGKIRDPQLDQGDFIFVLPEGPVEVEIKIRPLPAVTEEEAGKTVIKITPPPVVEEQYAEEPKKLEAPKPRITASIRKKTVIELEIKPLVSPEIQKYLDMLQGDNTAEKRVAAKFLYKEYPYDPAILRVVEAEILKGYNINHSDKQHVDAIAWLCRILGRSQQDKYLPTVQQVLDKTDSRKIRKYARKSIRDFPGYVPKEKSEQKESMYDNM